jgi:CheY-like chemotaxis protein
MHDAREPSLRACRVLVVEDEYMLAEELRTELENAEAVVIGPVAHLDEAIRLIRSEARIDGAVLDVNLGGDSAYPAADLLVARGVPMVFTTGYDPTAIPPRFAKIARCEKPVDIAKVARAISSAIHN